MNDYLKLLIIQYRKNLKAESTIKALADKYNTLKNIIKIFEKEFDVDSATGVQLDLLGRIVGINRDLGYVVPKTYFGFKGFPNTKGFGLAPFSNKFAIKFSKTQLNDNDYRFFIKSKIIKNVTKARMMGDLSLQKAIDFLFSNKAYLVDNYNMTYTIYVDKSFNLTLINYMKKLDLLPRPQGVNFKFIIQYNAANSFGFKNNPNSKGFGKGVFANKFF